MSEIKMEYELDWDGVIENDSPDFILLPEGDYSFEILNFERARHGGSDKLPACPKAVLYVKVDGGSAGTTTIKNNLFLHSKTEGMLCAFFNSIGQRKPGEKTRMNWGAVVGSKGRLKLGIRKYTNDSGKEMQFNEIKKFYESETSEQTSFEEGRF